MNQHTRHSLKMSAENQHEKTRNQTNKQTYSLPCYTPRTTKKEEKSHRNTENINSIYANIHTPHTNSYLRFRCIWLDVRIFALLFFRQGCYLVWLPA